MTYQDEPSGGILRLRGPADVDLLDPACSQQTATDRLTRLHARQLFGYRPVANPDDWQAIEPVADLAAAVPSTYNAGLGANHLYHVIHLRPGVLWDTEPARAVTAHDVVRGLKRMCNPVRPPAALGHFTSVILGMAEFCADYAAAVAGHENDARSFRDFQNSHDIPGVFALDDETLVVELIRPTLDLINVLALPCAAAAPVEYDEFVPGSAEFARYARSNGPYRLARHEPGVGVQLERNPVWQRDSDPIRAAHVDAVEVSVDRSGAARIAELVSAGAADLPWGLQLAEPHQELPTDPGHRRGFALDPYLAFNQSSTSCGGALADPAVRRALAAAIDKPAIAEIVAGSGAGAVVQVAASIIPPGNDGHRPIDAPPPDPARARLLLDEAGFPGELEFTAAHRDREVDAAIARSYAADLARAGVTVRLVAFDEAAYLRLLRDPAAVGEWDMATSALLPGWFHCNGRAFVEPLSGSGPAGTGGIGDYRSRAVDDLVEIALKSVEDPVLRDTTWQDVEDLVLADQPIVPLLFQTPGVPGLRSERVRDAIALPALGFGYDLANLRLAR